MGTGETAGDGETQPRSAPFPRTGSIDAVETVEDVRKVLRRDPGPGVPHSRLDPTVFRATFYGDAAPRGCVSQGVVEQRAQYLSRIFSVACGVELSLDVDDQADTLDGRLGLEAVGRLGENSGQIERLSYRRRFAGVEPREQ